MHAYRVFLMTGDAPGEPAGAGAAAYLREISELWADQAEAGHLTDLQIFAAADNDIIVARFNPGPIIPRPIPRPTVIPPGPAPPGQNQPGQVTAPADPSKPDPTPKPFEINLGDMPPGALTAVLPEDNQRGISVRKAILAALTAIQTPVPEMMGIPLVAWCPKTLVDHYRVQIANFIRSAAWPTSPPGPNGRFVRARQGKRGRPKKGTPKAIGKPCRKRL